MTPVDYVTEIVLPTVTEFRHERRSRRRAYLACMVTFHVKDHLRIAGATRIENAVRSVEPAAFDVVRAVCNGTKHVEADASHPIPFRAGDDTDREPVIPLTLIFGLWRWNDQGGREIGTASGPIDLYKAVVATLTAFKTTFPAHLGLCDLSGL